MDPPQEPDGRRAPESLMPTQQPDERRVPDAHPDGALACGTATACVICAAVLKALMPNSENAIYILAHRGSTDSKWTGKSTFYKILSTHTYKCNPHQNKLCLCQ